MCESHTIKETIIFKLWFYNYTENHCSLDKKKSHITLLDILKQSVHFGEEAKIIIRIFRNKKLDTLEVHKMYQWPN